VDEVDWLFSEEEKFSRIEEERYKCKLAGIAPPPYPKQVKRTRPLEQWEIESILDQEWRIECGIEGTLMIQVRSLRKRGPGRPHNENLVDLVYLKRKRGLTIDAAAAEALPGSADPVRQYREAVRLERAAYKRRILLEAKKAVAGL
jgi:hypothetical protein